MSPKADSLTTDAVAVGQTLCDFGWAGGQDPESSDFLRYALTTQNPTTEAYWVAINNVKTYKADGRIDQFYELAWNHMEATCPKINKRFLTNIQRKNVNY